MITAPLVMPDVITGLSLLLLFVALGHSIGWPSDRGMLTIWLAHVTFLYRLRGGGDLFTSARAGQVNRRGGDGSWRRAAEGVFFVITLPMIMPAVISGWLLAFTLSLDDPVIASFVSGPGATTLPMLVFSSVRMGVNPEINAPATLILGVVGNCRFYRPVFNGSRRKSSECVISSVQEGAEPPIPVILQAACALAAFVHPSHLLE